MLVHIPNQKVKPNRHRSWSKRLASAARRLVPEFLTLSMHTLKLKVTKTSGLTQIQDCLHNVHKYNLKRQTPIAASLKKREVIGKASTQQTTKSRTMSSTGWQMGEVQTTQSETFQKRVSKISGNQSELRQVWVKSTIFFTECANTLFEIRCTRRGTQIAI